MGPEGYGEYKARSLGTIWATWAALYREKLQREKRRTGSRASGDSAFLLVTKRISSSKVRTQPRSARISGGTCGMPNSGNEVARRGGTRGGLRWTWNSLSASFPGSSAHMLKKTEVLRRPGAGWADGGYYGTPKVQP